MENRTTFRIELDVAASKVIHQFMTSNDHIEKQLSEAIQKAIDSFDFEREVEGLVTRQLKEALGDSFKYGKLQKLVEERTNSIFQKLIDAEFEAYEKLKK